MSRQRISQESAQRKHRLWQYLFTITACALLSVACGGGSDSVTSSSSEVFEATGISLPSEVSAVSAKTESSNPESILSLLRPNADTMMGVEELGASSDYHMVVVRKFVEVRALEVFSILSSIFDAVRQTHYEDHVGDGWYKNMVSFKDTGGDGGNQTRLEEWYVRSRMFEEQDGSMRNRVNLKIMENHGKGGAPELVRVEVDITEAPTLNDDGSVATMGEWEIRAIFGDSGGGNFHATATTVTGGASQVTLEESSVEDMDGTDVTIETRALIVRSESSGHGVVEFPNWEACFGGGGGGEGGGGEGGGCANGPPTVSVNFAYNSNYLSLQKGEAAAVSFDREDAHDLVHRYGLFSAIDGSNVEKTLNFGFPVIDGDGHHGWYGAWQDRHELRLNGDNAADGVTVTREGLPPDETAPTYTTARFDGALTKVTLEQGSMDQLDGVTAEIHLWNEYRLSWNATADPKRWDLCVGFGEFGGCETSSDFTEKLSSLQIPGEFDQRWIHINGCNEVSQGNWTCTDYVYDVDGFYEATWGENGNMVSTGTPLQTSGLANGFELWASVGGQNYIQYTGEFDPSGTTNTGWVQKTMTGFDQETWTPSFDDEADTEFLFEMGREYFVNQRGSNLRVTRVAENGNADDYAVYMEVHRVAKPVADLTTIIAADAKLVDAWDPDGSSKFTLNTDPTSANYLLLQYDTLSERDEGDGATVGTVVTKDMWGLRIDGDSTTLADAVLYNWEYQEENDGWGGVTYLMDQAEGYVLLAEPIHFDPIALARTDDLVQETPENQWLSFSLAFDGWLHGIPDPWFELQRIGFEGGGMSAVLANNVRIPDGTLLTRTQQSGSDSYYVKAVDVGIFLGQVNAFPNGSEPDLTLADDVDLDLDLPSFTAPSMTTTLPTNAPLLYVEGLPVNAGE